MQAARVAIVGGSLGGLTAALLLRELGHDVTVYERSSAELEQRGAGIGFLPASYRYLADRGRIDLDTVSVSTAFIRYLDRGGRVVHEQAQAYRFSNWNTVYRNLLRCFGPERYLLGRECVAIEPDAGEVRVRFLDGEQAVCDLVVCADGIGSRARAALLPEVRARYAGYVAWRGLAPEAEVPGVAAFTDAITYHVYANSHILVYPIPGLDGSLEPGRRLVNFVWYRNYLEGGDLDDLMTDAEGVRHEVSLPPGKARVEHVEEMRTSAAARLPAAIAAAVRAVERPFVQAILDIDVPNMAFGRVCLVGDAAFAVRPHAAAGTAKAAADAWALAEAMEREPDVESALRSWEPGQLELGRNLLERTRRIGRRSQVDCNWTPGDPELIFGLHGPGR